MGPWKGYLSLYARPLNTSTTLPSFSIQGAGFEVRKL